MHVQNLMNSLRDIRIFLGLVPKESPCTKSNSLLLLRLNIQSSAQQAVACRWPVPQTLTEECKVGSKSFGACVRGQLSCSLAYQRNCGSQGTQLMEENMPAALSPITKILQHIMFIPFNTVHVNLHTLYAI